MVEIWHQVSLSVYRMGLGIWQLGDASFLRRAFLMENLTSRNDKYNTTDRIYLWILAAYVSVRHTMFVAAGLIIRAGEEIRLTRQPPWWCHLRNTKQYVKVDCGITRGTRTWSQIRIWKKFQRSSLAGRVMPETASEEELFASARNPQLSKQ